MIQVPPQHAATTPTKLAFIGEAPSDEEIIKLQPLVGPSGRVFNALLRTAGLNRPDFFITNVFNVKAEDNDVEPWLRDPAFYTPHLERLGEELRAAQPTVIVPLGGTAVWALTGDKNIVAVRGTVLPATRVVPGAKLLPTFHPAHVIRQWKFFATVVRDLMRAASEAEAGPEIVYPKRRLWLKPTVQDVEKFLLSKCMTPDLLSVDIETGWGQITSIQFAPTVEEAISIPFFDLMRPNRSYWLSAAEEVRVWELVAQVLATDVPKLGQNFTYDTWWLLEKMKMPIRNYVEDTKLLHHALYAELQKDLEFMGNSYGTQGAWKRWGHSYTKEKRDD